MQNVLLSININVLRIKGIGKKKILKLANGISQLCNKHLANNFSTKFCSSKKKLYFCSPNFSVISDRI